ncbi:MAG: DUF3999 family protein [Bacteroidota bacterium]
MKELRSIFLLGLILFTTAGIAQVDKYNYRSAILQADTGWNDIVLPQEIFSKANESLSDLRIYRIDPRNQMAIEQPYIIDIQEAKKEKKEAEFKIINTTRTKGLNSYTFELSNQEPVNNIHLDFANPNFDWEVHLEGSMDQNSWSSITHNYRIVSIKNQNTSFEYTDLSIPESKFNYYRITFPSLKRPNLRAATLTKEVQSKSSYTSYTIENPKITEDEKYRSTIIELDLGRKFPVSQIELKCTTEKDYYRPIKIEAVIDSFQSGNDWRYRYTQLYQGTLSSVNENVFSFFNRQFQKFKVTVKNFNDQPLDFSEFNIRGPNYHLITRFDDSENLFLCFGNEEANRPLYDISYFKNNIPETINRATLDAPIYFSSGNDDKSPIFNKWWLWGIMILVIVLLGSFTLKMLKESK